MYWRTSRATPGGVRQLPGSPHAQRTQRDSNSFPSQSVLHCEDIPDPSFNIGRSLASVLAGSLAGVGLAVVVFILLFVET